MQVTITTSSTSTLDSVYVNVGESPTGGDIGGRISGAPTVGADAVALATDTTGNYVATVADNGGLTISVSNSGTENAGVTLGVASNSLDFTQLKAALALDSSTSVTADGTEVFSLVNTGTGNSFLVEDQGTDTTPFVIDASGKRRYRNN